MIKVITKEIDMGGIFK